MLPNGLMNQDTTWYVGLSPDDIVLDGDPAPPMERGTAAPHFLAHVYCGQMVAHLSNCWSLVSLLTNSRSMNKFGQLIVVRWVSDGWWANMESFHRQSKWILKCSYHVDQIFCDNRILCLVLFCYCSVFGSMQLIKPAVHQLFTACETFPVILYCIL